MSSDMIEFISAGQRVPGHLALPKGSGPFAGIVVIQEWWGLNAHIKDVADRFAAEGYAAVAPDLYRGQVASEPDEARKLAMELDHPRAIRDIQAAIDYLRMMDNISPKQIGVVGFCMGGGLTGLMAHKGHHVGAAVMFYGRLNGLDTAAVARDVRAPLMGNFGGNDQSIPVAEVQKAADTLADLGKRVDFKIYSGAPHAFFNDTRPHIYHDAASKDAWNRTLAWFRHYLV